MTTRATRRGRTVTASLATLCLTGAFLLASGSATSASIGFATPQASGYAAKVLRAVDTCEDRATRGTTLPQILSCTRGLAAPSPGNTTEADIWNTVLDCLSAGWWAAKDHMYPGGPGFDEGVVNGCLEDQGIL